MAVRNTPGSEGAATAYGRALSAWEAVGRALPRVRPALRDAARTVSRPTPRDRLGALVRLLFAIAGIVVLVLLVRHAGAHALARVLGRAAPWVPLVLAIEAVRVGLDAVATRLALGRAGARVPARILVRAQLVGTAVSGIAPAGRTAGEATKAALLAPWAGAAASTAAATSVQAVALVAGAVVSIPCTVASFVVTGASLLSWLLVAQTTLLLAVGIVLRAGMRARSVSGFLKRRMARLARHADSFQATAREDHLLSPGPLVAMTIGRALQIAQYAILAHAVGVDVSAVRALFAQGLNFLALAAGALVPAQLGVSEGTFALAAKALQTSVANAMAIALLAHVLQAVFVPLGALVPLVWKVRLPPMDTSKR